MYNYLNALWRWQYWQNEIKLLVKTKLMGVGFGTPYADNNIFNEIINRDAVKIPDDAFGYSINKVLFITSQHNSFLNMFYRLGVVGGMLF